MNNTLYILGTRGIPARHGGFETFAERLALYLAHRKWRVTVYCQEEGNGEISTSNWCDVERVHVPVGWKGVAGTIVYDWKAACHASRQEGLFLTLGYNTAVFNLLQRIKSQVNIINMDGIEWRRDKWGWFAKIWLWLNERIGCWVGNHLVADHPRIKEHLLSVVNTEKISMIPYGADEVTDADMSLLTPFGVEVGRFSVIIARPEPENSILEMVCAFSYVQRNHKLVVLGNYQPTKNQYHRQVMEAASSEVIFPGAIYDPAVVQALRYHSRLYLHGHRVGGTNPSLVEAMGAGCAVLAYDNEFNRWVAGGGAEYFKDELDCTRLLDALLIDDSAIKRMQAASRALFKEKFTWPVILKAYEDLLVRHYLLTRN